MKNMKKAMIGLAVLAQLVFASAAFAEQEDVDNYNKAATSNKNSGVDLYGY